LEDILQQDPREKFELFPKLGYYFISFRAVAGKSLPRGFHDPLDPSADLIRDDALGEGNLYLVVYV
jgi:magnesium transporter